MKEVCKICAVAGIIIAVVVLAVFGAFSGCGRDGVELTSEEKAVYRNVIEERLKSPYFEIKEG